MMSSNTPTTGKTPKSEHGTLASYVVGFVLSLVFTLIPYYLVVHKSLGANTLVATIIGFAILQLIIQVVFFLHLGREKKPRWNLFFLMSTIGIILLVVGGSIWIMSHLHYNMAGTQVADKIASDEGVHQIEGEQVGTCPGTGTNHKIQLQNNAAQPSHVDAQLCDTLTITNLGDKERMVMFGIYGEHQLYAGQTHLTIRPGRNKVFTLTQPGTHHFHDHMQREVTGSFTVASP